MTYVVSGSSDSFCFFSLSEYSKDGSYQHKPEASVDKNAIKLLTKTENSFLVGALTRTAGKIL